MGMIEDLVEDQKTLEQKFDALLRYLKLEAEIVYPDFEAYRKERKPLKEVHWEIHPEGEHDTL